MRAGLVVGMSKRGHACGVRLDTPEGTYPSVRPGHRWWDIKRILIESVGNARSGFIWFEMERNFRV